MKQQLLILVEWAKYIPPFCELPLDDQVTGGGGRGASGDIGAGGGGHGDTTSRDIEGYNVSSRKDRIGGKKIKNTNKNIRVDIAGFAFSCRFRRRSPGGAAAVARRRAPAAGARAPVARVQGGAAARERPGDPVPAAGHGRQSDSEPRPRGADSAAARGADRRLGVRVPQGDRLFRFR